MLTVGMLMIVLICCVWLLQMWWCVLWPHISWTLTFAMLTEACRAWDVALCLILNNFCEHCTVWPLGEFGGTLLMSFPSWHCGNTHLNFPDQQTDTWLLPTLSIPKKMAKVYLDFHTLRLHFSFVLLDKWYCVKCHVPWYIKPQCWRRVFFLFHDCILYRHHNEEQDAHQTVVWKPISITFFFLSLKFPLFESKGHENQSNMLPA